MEKRMIRLVCALAALLLCCAFALGCAAADGAQGGNEVERLLAVDDFKFQQVEKGIGYGVLAVYSAPSTDALRGANGKAAVDTNQKMAEAGFDESGWLLVRYEKDNGGYRVGYVEKRKVKDYKARMSTPAFDRIPVTAAEAIDVLDDPHEKGNVLGTLKAGEDFTVLGKYTYSGSWWYVECTLEGKTARGFIAREGSAFYAGDTLVKSVLDLGDPAVSPRGGEKIGTAVIKEGDRKNVRRTPDASGTIISKVYPGMEYPVYDKKVSDRGIEYFYVFVEDDSEWGWISSGVATLAE